MSNAPKPFYERIDEQQVQGWVTEKGRSYRAWGTFRGKEIRARGRSEAEAVNQWREAANFKTNE